MPNYTVIAYGDTRKEVRIQVRGYTSDKSKAIATVKRLAEEESHKANDTTLKVIAPIHKLNTQEEYVFLQSKHGNNIVVQYVAYYMQLEDLLAMTVREFLEKYFSMDQMPERAMNLYQDHMEEWMTMQDIQRGFEANLLHAVDMENYFGVEGYKSATIYAVVETVEL
jgi:5-bromo-4-chloroindolyl phosphate hydrolysis protein